MPIDTNSEKWEDGRWIDTIRIEINNIFRADPEKAFTLDEITELLTKKKPHVFSDSLMGDDEVSVASRRSLVASRLERLEWLDHVEIRTIDGELYYGGGEKYHHLIHDVNVELPREIETLEDDLEDKLSDLEYRMSRIEEGSELEDRVLHLERRFSEEVGPI